MSVNKFKEFIKACKSGDISEVERYIREGDDPSDDDNYAIQRASGNGHTDVVKLLLSDKRVDPSADNNTAIQLATKYGHRDVVRLLLEDDRVIKKGIELGQKIVIDYIMSERERKIKELCQ